MFCLHVCLYTACVSGVHESQKVSDPLGLDLQTAVNCHVGAGNEAVRALDVEQFLQCLCC